MTSDDFLNYFSENFLAPDNEFGELSYFYYEHIINKIMG